MQVWQVKWGIVPMAHNPVNVLRVEAMTEADAKVLFIDHIEGLGIGRAGIWSIKPYEKPTVQGRVLGVGY